MKLIKKIFIISFLLLLLIYVTNITQIPEKIVVLDGESLKLPMAFGLKIEKPEESEAILTATSLEKEITKIKTSNYQLKLFGRIPIKDVSVNVIPKTYVVPLGNIVGLKLYTNGVLVVGMSEIEGIDKIKYKPYENTGIEEGDMIIKLNDEVVTCTADLLKKVSISNGNEIKVDYVRDGKINETTITAIKAADQNYKLGLWVRDAAAGVGTASFYDPVTKTFAALGHGILDVDTDELLNISKGEFITTKIVSITKGEKGNPGKIQGSIDNQINVGNVYKNTNFGVYGKVTNISALNIDTKNAIEIASRDEIKQGSAKILCTLENNQIKEYDVQIQKIYKENNDNNKSMLIKVTDKELKEKTGGIIQGMSGSPIIQNGKMVGALTHVLVNNPEMGYGVFADLMLKQARQIY